MLRILLSFTLLFAATAAAQAPPPPCSERPAYALLDFWTGEWNVHIGDQLVGTNRIEPILSGCALLEHWKDARGSEGKSLFYFDLVSERWKQVWVTGSGSMKEKAFVGALDGGAVQFQGEVKRPGGATVLDRTTLTPLPGGTVRQLIEISSDRGETWQPVFDAVYSKRAGGAS